jgi:hypothetical protein
MMKVCLPWRVLPIMNLVFEKLKKQPMLPALFTGNKYASKQ